MSRHIRTGDIVLDEASREFKYTQNIDVFNNMILWSRHTGLWRKCGAPKEITGVYARSPLIAAFQAAGERMQADRKRGEG